MKKFLTLALVLVLALAMTIPAMAFTDKAKSDSSPYELDIYLVEYEDNDFFGITTLPPSDRGYAKNEIVAAVVEFVVPKNEALATDFDALVLSGDDVSLKVTENDFTGTVASLLTNRSSTKLAFDFADDELTSDSLVSFDTGDGKQTNKVLFFAKVTGDEASLTAKLDAAGEGFVSNVLKYEDYAINNSSDDEYVISEDGGDELFTILIDDETNESEGLSIHYNGSDYTVVDRASGIGFIGVKADTTTGLVDKDDDKVIYRNLMEIYEDVFVDVFGFDFAKLGGIVDDDTFLDLVGTDNIEATVEIKPWTAYVTVPDNIVVDPPKTGDAASIVGFVMIVLAAAAVVAVKKVRA